MSQTQKIRVTIIADELKWFEQIGGGHERITHVDPRGTVIDLAVDQAEPLLAQPEPPIASVA